MMKLTPTSAIRPAATVLHFGGRPQLRPRTVSRGFRAQPILASDAPASKRRAVTPFNDDGHVPWTELSAGEKTGRAVQQTVNFGMVIVGLVLTVRK